MPFNPEDINFGDVRKTPIPIDINLSDVLIPFTPKDKKAGDVLKSQDWNAGMQEILRLNKDKVDRKGDTITGSLTIGDALTVMGNTTLSAGTKDTISVLSLKGQLSKGIAATIVLQNSAGGAGGGGSLDFNGYDVNTDTGKRVPTARIQSIDDGDYSSHLGFYTKPSGNINELRERVRIASNGNVGIGINSPMAKLDIQSAVRSGTHPTAVKGLYVTGDFGPDSDGVEFRHTNGSQGIGFGYNAIYATGGNTDQDLGLKPKGAGKVNIIGTRRSISLEGGTQSPNAGVIRFGDGTGWKLHFGRSQESSDGALNSGTTGVLMTIQDTGNVGISTTSPIAKLDIPSVTRSGTHPTSVKGLYVTGDFGPDSDGVEFRHTNGTQGIGFGYNTIYATGGNPNQDLGLKPKGAGKVSIVGNLEVSGNFRSGNVRKIAVASDSIRTTSRIWVDLPNMTVSATTGGGSVLVWFKAGGVQGVDENVRVGFRLLVDDGQKAFTLHEFHNRGWELRDVTLTSLESLTPGTHSFKVQWYAEQGTGGACWYNDTRSLMVLEL
jgi:hypothetical protein